MSVLQGSIAVEGRLAWLQDRLASAGTVTIAEAAETLDVSEMTIRRDLVELEERGVARRVRGGAQAVGPQQFAERHQRATRAKSRIAAKLRELLPTAGVVAFDASSTVTRLASLLRGARDLTVLTNGYETFVALQGQPGIEPVLTGGRLDTRTGSLVGPLACRSAAQLSAALFVTSAAAIDPSRGSMEVTLEDAEVKRTFAEHAASVVVAVDWSKAGHSSVALALAWDQIELLVTELDPADRRLDPYRELVEIQ